MARLYLHCAICDRKQADGLISGAAWARYEVATEAVGLDHRPPRRSSLRVCPTCLGAYPDWQQRIAVQIDPGDGGRPAFEAAG